MVVVAVAVVVVAAAVVAVVAVAAVVVGSIELVSMSVLVWLWVILGGVLCGKWARNKIRSNT